MSTRTVRVNELAQRELSAILRKHYQAEAVAITISDVKVSPDLHDARVFVAIVGDEATQTLKLRWLRSKAVEIRQEFARRVTLKFLPKFEYRIDASTERTTRMHKLLDDMGPMTDAAPASTTEIPPAANA